jgi:ATP-dependent Clp protease adaptor protein ClpS
MGTTITPDELLDPDIDEDLDLATPWIVIVWDDPVNLMKYVVLVFRRLFGFSEAKATRLMLQVHNEGRAVVSSGTREEAERDCQRLHEHGLWATMQRQS